MTPSDAITSIALERGQDLRNNGKVVKYRRRAEVPIPSRVHPPPQLVMRLPLIEEDRPVSEPIVFEKLGRFGPKRCKLPSTAERMIQLLARHSDG